MSLVVNLIAQRSRDVIGRLQFVRIETLVLFGANSLPTVFPNVNWSLSTFGRGAGMTQW